jgi:hypothetical protein
MSVGGAATATSAPACPGDDRRRSVPAVAVVPTQGAEPSVGTGLGCRLGLGTGALRRDIVSCPRRSAAAPLFIDPTPVCAIDGGLVMWSMGAVI